VTSVPTARINQFVQLEKFTAIPWGSMPNVAVSDMSS